MHHSQQAWGRSLRSCIMITTTTTKQKSRGRKSTLHDESCLVLRDQLWIDVAVLRGCSFAVWVRSNLRRVLNMDCIYLYTPSLHNGKKGNWGGRMCYAVGSGPALCHKRQNCCASADPWWTLLGALGSSLQFSSRCQASGFGTSWCFPVEAIVWSKSQWGI